MRIEDEYGTPWLVEAGDPARKSVNLLKSLGFEYIVLPRSVLTTGIPCDTIESDTVAGIRMAECVEVLTSNISLSK